jgi:hypothetical protein
MGHQGITATDSSRTSLDSHSRIKEGRSWRRYLPPVHDNARRRADHGIGFQDGS